MLCVLITQYCTVGGNPPVYAKTIVKDAYATVSFRGIEIVALVLEDGGLAQHCKAVGEAAWDEELAVVVFCKFNGNMTAISRGPLPYVNSNVQYRTFDAPHKLALGERGTLEMKARMTP